MLLFYEFCIKMFYPCSSAKCLIKVEQNDSSSHIIILAAYGADSLLYLIEIDEKFHQQKKLM